MIISDIDGVWTDGSFYKGTDGQEFKKFNVNPDIVSAGPGFNE